MASTIAVEPARDLRCDGQQGRFALILLFSFATAEWGPEWAEHCFRNGYSQILIISREAIAFVSANLQD